MSSDSNVTIRPFSELSESIESKPVGGYEVDAIEPTYVLQPASIDELSEILRSAKADQLSVIPWGGGSQMGLGNIPSAYDVAIDLTAIDEVLRYDPDDMTMSVQTGCRLANLNAMLAENRQVLPVDTAFPEQATIGGLTAVGASGPRRLGYGPLRDLIIGMTVISVDGVVAKAGGNVVKNVTGYDMMRLHHGALGSLGIIVSINLKVIPKPQAERTVIAYYASLDQADSAARNIIQSQLGVTSLVVTNPQATQQSTGSSDDYWAVAVRCEAPPSAVVRQAERVAEYLNAGAVSVVAEDSTEESVRRWAEICLALDQRRDSPDIVVKFGKAPSQMLSAGTAVVERIGEIGPVRLTLDYGSGLGYAQLARIERDGASPGEFLEFFAGLGDHTTLMTGPSGMKLDIDVFGSRGPGFSMVEALKANFDPDGMLNPGRSIGRLASMATVVRTEQ